MTTLLILILVLAITLAIFVKLCSKKREDYNASDYRVGGTSRFFIGLLLLIFGFGGAFPLLVILGIGFWISAIWWFRTASEMTPKAHVTRSDLPTPLPRSFRS
jgi:hypothetical protein